MMYLKTCTSCNVSFTTDDETITRCNGASMRHNDGCVNTSLDDELRQQILIEFKQILKLAPADYTENCTNVVMALIHARDLQREREIRADELLLVSHWNDDGNYPFEQYYIDRIIQIKGDTHAPTKPTNQENK